MKVIFIAGPLTTGFDGKDLSVVEAHIKEAEQYQIALANAGIGSYFPHTHTAFRWKEGSIALDEYYRDVNRRILEKVCDAVLAIPGWEMSKGAQDEVEWAQHNNIPVFFPKTPKDIEEIAFWHNE